MSLTLFGAQTPDDAALPIRVMSPPTVKGAGPPLFVGAGGAWNAGVWHRKQGRLVLQVAAFFGMLLWCDAAVV